MNKIVALILLGVLAVVLVQNRSFMDRLTVDLIVTTVTAPKSMILLGTAALGVIIGNLLK